MGTTSGFFTMTILNWATDSSDICEEILANPSDIKVLLKTKNETEMLERWVKHHSRMFGRENLIIFDNMSDRPETLSILSKVGEESSVYQFSGFHNAIHSPVHFHMLYTSLAKSSRYHTFLDTDELLVWIENDFRVVADKSALERILMSKRNALPGIWFENIPGQAHLFNSRPSYRPGQIRGGKPLASDFSQFSSYVGHNVQVGPDFFQPLDTANLFVLHLKNLDRSQRIEANLEKLRSYNLATKMLQQFNLVGGNFDQDSIAELDVNLLDGSTKLYVSEIQQLLEGVPERERPRNIAELVIGEYLRFNDPMDEENFRDFMQNPERELDRALRNPLRSST